MVSVRKILVCVVASVVAWAPGARADDEVFRALGLGLGIINNLQQQQIQQQQIQQQQAPRQASPQRQQTARPAPAQPVDTAAARREREAVREVQTALNRLGYDAGPVDGDPGPLTRDAIAAFRADYGLDPGAGIDDQLAGALRVAARNAPAAPVAETRTPRTAGAPAAVSPPLWSKPERQAAPATAEMQGGTLMIDGRVAAVTNSDFEGLTQTFNGVDMAVNLRRVVFDYTVALTPDPLADDEAALSTLAFLQPDLTAEILEAAFGRPLDRNEANAVRLGLVQRDLIQQLNPFETQDVIAAVRANADRIVRSDLPAPPVPLRVFCSLRLGAYDFETQSFPIVNGDRRCNAAVRGAEDAELVGAEVVPERMPMTPDAAEQFQTQRYGQTYLAAFDAELDVEPGPLGKRSAPRLAVSGRTGLRLLTPGSLTEVIHEFDQGEPSGGGAPTMEDGVLLVDGRMVAISTSNVSLHETGLDAEALQTGMRNRIFAYGLALRPEALDDDAAAFATLDMLPPQMVVEIVRSRARRSTARRTGRTRCRTSTGRAARSRPRSGRPAPRRARRRRCPARPRTPARPGATGPGCRRWPRAAPGCATGGGRRPRTPARPGARPRSAPSRRRARSPRPWRHSELLPVTSSTSGGSGGGSRTTALDRTAAPSAFSASTCDQDTGPPSTSHVCRPESRWWRRCCPGPGRDGVGAESSPTRRRRRSSDRVCRRPTVSSRSPTAYPLSSIAWLTTTSPVSSGQRPDDSSNNPSRAGPGGRPRSRRRPPCRGRW